MNDKMDGKFEQQSDVPKLSSKVSNEANATKFDSKVIELASTAANKDMGEFTKEVAAMTDDQKRQLRDQNEQARVYLLAHKSELDNTAKGVYGQTGNGQTPETFDATKYTS